MSNRRLLLLPVLLLCLFAGCLSQGADQKTSVKPGINKNFEGKVDVDKWVGIFEGESREVFKHRRDIVQALGLKPGMSVADVGAGTGFFSLLFADKVGPSGKVFAVDIAPDFLKHIDAKAKERHLTNVTTVHCTQNSVALPPDSIDLAFICDVYHHFEYPHSTMRSIHRALRPGGRVVVIDFIRIEGVSSDWVLGHVRAGQKKVTQEIEADGFELAHDLPPTPYLKENYMIRFRKKG